MKAFPIKGWNGYEESIHEGMDLRDYFAAKAMQGLLTRPIDELSNHMTNKHEDLPTYIGYISYLMADAMMKARDNG